MFGLVIFREEERGCSGQWVCASSVHFEPRGQRTYRVLRRWDALIVGPLLADFRRMEKRRQRSRAVPIPGTWLDGPATPTGYMGIVSTAGVGRR